MCVTCTGPLNSSRVPGPPRPFSCEANGTLCQALKLSSWTHDCQPVVKPHAAPDALSFAAACSTSGQVFGGLFGSRPAFLKASSLTYSTWLDLLNAIETRFPEASAHYD